MDLQQSLPGTVDPSPEMTTAPSPVVAAPIMAVAETSVPVETSPARGPTKLPPLVPPPVTNQVRPAALEGGVESIGWERLPVPVDTDAANSEVSHISIWRPIMCKIPN